MTVRACGQLSRCAAAIGHSDRMNHDADALAQLDQLSTALRVLASGPLPLDWLTGRLRAEFRDARVTRESVIAMAMNATVLVGRPDGRICRLLDVLDGQTLTHRVEAATTDRTDLWTNVSLQPLLLCASLDPIPLVTGGELTAAEFGHPALLGPAGWLPDVPAGTVLALTVEGGRVRIEALPNGVGATAAQEQRVRAILGRHIREEAWWSDVGEPNREAELNRALGHALIEDPELFRRPVSPLVELLHDVLSEHSRQHVFDDTAAWAAGDVVSFSVAGMPESLHAELNRRAAKYGMSFDRFIVATLGHCAWRTPFAEDLGPWESWEVPTAQSSAPTILRAVKNPSDPEEPPDQRHSDTTDPAEGAEGAEGR
ncbi:hypothetical protein ACOCJ4_13725 [Knoellia sp. CPCC 206435]|uniref:hypothetical protein n=1 Tax=Knoellia terrae TaxID=3404797 RepID=UPI003B4336A6